MGAGTEPGSSARGKFSKPLQPQIQWVLFGFVADFSKTGSHYVVVANLELCRQRRLFQI